MKFLLLGTVALLSFANGANDNFKGVATLWGAGCASYRRALAWATVFTFFGSLVAIRLGSGLAAKFSGAKLVDGAVFSQLPFLAAVAVAGGATVLLAARFGFPISTTHALTGALIGAGMTAAGISHVRFAALGSGVVLPLLFSPLAGLALTLGVYSLVAQLARRAGNRNCVCVDHQQAALAVETGASASVMVAGPPSVRWAPAEECETGLEAVRLSVADALHWISGATISFARGLNDTPKIAAVLLVAVAGLSKLDYLLVALTMATGGLLGAARVAHTMGKKITPMATSEAVSANLVSAALVALASVLGLPVSTTHVTSGGIFGIALLRKQEADWRCMRDIVLSWVATLPIGAALAIGFFWLLNHQKG